MTQTVVIAGGGPVGLLLAIELRLAGVPTVVLERRSEQGSESFSRLLHGRSVDLLAQRGLLDELGELPRWPFVHFAHFPLDLTLADPWEYWLIVPQTRVERVLADRAVALGADLRTGTEVVGVTQDADGVTVTTRPYSPGPTAADGDAGDGGRGGETEIRGAYLVGADGQNSAVRDLAGFEAPAVGPSWYGTVAHVEGYVGPPGGTTTPGGMFGAIPDVDFHHLMTTEFDRPTPGHDEPVTFDEVRASVRRATGADVTEGRPRWLARYGNVARIPSTYRDGRVFLAGDAAHVHFHAVGHGLNTGLNDAVNLGWKLAAELSGWAPPGLLDSYDRERRPVGERAVQVMLAQLTLLHPYDTVRPLRALFGELTDIPEVVRRLVRPITDVRYPLEAFGEAADPALLGGRVDDPAAVAAPLLAGRGALLDRSGGEADLSAAAEWNARVDLVTVPAAAAEAGADGEEGSVGTGGTGAGGEAPTWVGRAVLVRPDGHVAWVDTAGPGEPTDVKGLSAALAAWFGEPSPPAGGARI
ncbi:FAD-dependent monooxygenase [Frankia sp. CNm7]|uniref:FAD-dependent monooxygenase n=1 Tax=Frankia nepalensis TaxID=1836974 RepID=A0A937RIR9_9ACTN|nr:FAD-dependent monooxygenase [Frankia nepalensis]MBL7497616.1 FAD-dependent monooxygenase [Frankia nepalensis]MBL7516422.1 FAD-dependent monooxygenase [Frankia nepalensis]MBL7518026.1 FAD-dependent monooxygenase [Frankia nepalensis]MBL7633018.1 FAD-dependent monooxygenase [Frankia nepalensis]